MYKYAFWVLLLVVGVTQAELPGVCISDDEANLMDVVNDYRVNNALPAVPWSNVLMNVGQWHAEDASINDATIFNPPCNIHSWSNDMPNLWNAVCYTSDHAAAAEMWAKPSQISGGSFTGNGFENAAQGAEDNNQALGWWQASPGHNDVILNQNIWANYTWRSMGVGVSTTLTNYHYLWFSYTADVSPLMPLCSELIFTNGFE